jgi:hypothetical protein
MSDKPQWNNRDVEFIEFDIEAGEAIMDAAQGTDRKAAFYLTLVHSARYADDGKPVFASLAEVRAQPFRLIQRIQHLASLATQRNRVEQVDGIEDPDIPLDAARGDVPTSPRAGNGADRP